MRSRGLSRLLALLALLGSVGAILLVIQSADSGSKGDTGTTAGITGSTKTTGTTSTTSTTASGHGPKYYVVKSGDVLSAIADSTGVPLAEIEQLNPKIDAQTLQAGQRIKLRP